MNITNVTFLNNTVSIPVAIDRRELPIGGGNIFLQDNTAGQWINNSVRIHNCQIEGGVAVSGGGILLIHVVKYAVSCQASNEMNGLFISIIHNSHVTKPSQLDLLNGLKVTCLFFFFYDTGFSDPSYH